MIAKTIITSFSICMLNSFCQAQQLQQKDQPDIKPLTLSRSEYDEFFPGDPFRQVGSVTVNIKTKLIYRFTDTITASYQNTGRWLSIDPLQEKYPSLSPYGFSNNSPVKLVDYDGRDFGVEINHSTQTITISADFITTEKSYDRLLAATNYIKEQANGKFVYTWTDENNVSYSYDIVFAFSITKIEPSYSSNTPAENYLLNNPGDLKNSFDVIDDKAIGDKATAVYFGSSTQQTIAHKFVRARESLKGQTITNTSETFDAALIADVHEIFSHVFGKGKINMGGMHSGMVGDVNNHALESSGSNIPSFAIVDILKQIGLSKENFEYNPNATEGPENKVTEVPLESGETPNIENGYVKEK